MSGTDGGRTRAAPGAERWRFETMGAISTSPAVVDGTVYVGSYDHNLYAVGTARGTEQWQFTTGRYIRSSPTVVGGTVYIGSHDDTLYAVDVANGTEQWRFETGNIVPYSPTVVDGTVYIGSHDDTLYAVDAGSGTLEWRFGTHGKIRSSPTVADGTVYVASRDNNLYAVDADGGTFQWHFETEGNVRSSLTVADGTVYVGDADDSLYAVDATRGTEKWRFETDGKVWSSPTVVGGTVYIGSHDTNLYAVDVANGTEQWHFETDDDVWSSPAVNDGTVYVGSDDNGLHAVDATNGTEKWRFDTDDPIRSSPTVADGTVYVGSTDGNLYAVATDRPTTTSGVGQRTASSTGTDDGREVTSSHRPSAVETPTTEIPQADAVERPPRREGLSREDLTLVENIGAGGQAIINKARLPDGHRPPAVVAVREPNTSTTLARGAVEAFLSQAETWATVDAHERDKRRWDGYEHIVGVVATGERQPWLAMEYVDGGDLTGLLAEHPDGLPVGQALWLGEGVCKGLEVAHNLGRVHLDVKPGNVLLRETDGWPWPKLADWGLARTLAEETGTMESRSVEYAGPEQFDSAAFGDPDQLTDIYQTGALVYTLLTGDPPATGSQFEVMQQVLSEEPLPAPSERREKVSAAVDAAVGLALEREKTARYGSIGNFADALHALRTGGRLPPAVVRRLE